MMDSEQLDPINRRTLLRGGVGLAALATLLKGDGLLAATKPHHAPKAKRVIFLCQSGAPSQLDLFDYKPQLETHQGEELPDSVRRGQRLTSMTADQRAARSRRRGSHSKSTASAEPG